MLSTIGTIRSNGRSGRVHASTLAAVCAAVAAFAASGCALFRGSSDGDVSDGMSLDEYIANAIPLPPDASGAPAQPVVAPVSENTEPQASEPEIDELMFTPAGEPILRTGYIIRVAVVVGDRVEVNPSEVQISDRCEITLPLVGKVDCAGLTINGLRSRLTTRYGDFFKNPEVTANFVVRDAFTSPWGRVLVQGRVRQEGWVSIPATRSLKVSDAIQRAGGFAQFAKRGNVRVSRRRKDGSIEYFRVDLEEIGRRGKTENDMPLKSGDVVYVYESSI